MFKPGNTFEFTGFEVKPVFVKFPGDFMPVNMKSSTVISVFLQVVDPGSDPMQKSWVGSGSDPNVKMVWYWSERSRIMINGKDMFLNGFRKNCR